MDTYYKECFLEDIYHFEALDVWEELKPGKQVTLSLNKDNTKKIKVSLNEDGTCVLGLLSEDDSKSMLPFLKSGWNKIFLGKICFIDEKIDIPRIKIVVYIRQGLEIKDKIKVDELIHGKLVGVQVHLFFVI